MSNDLSRRKFLKTSVQSVALLTVGFNLPLNNARASEAAATEGFTPNAWLTINPDNTVTILSSVAEMGQGTFTSLPMFIAEELELDESKVRIEHAPVGPEFVNRFFKFQATGGSTSVRWAFNPLRQIGADVRELLKNAAAEKWQADAASLTARSAVVHHPDGRSATYAELAPQAAQLPMPANTPLKSKSEWRILGTDFKRKDTPLKVNGTAQFGIDVQLDGLLIATIQACPTFGGTLKSVDPAPAMAIKGVKHVVELPNAVAVCALDYWSARKGLNALEPVWDLGANAELDTAAIRTKLLKEIEQPGIEGLNEGDIAAVKEKAEKSHTALYESPYLAHATMEPMNATVDATGDVVKVWSPSQSIQRDQLFVAKALGVPPTKVEVIATFMGGGFGRRGSGDFSRQAALIAKQVEKPVKLVWSREEDMAHDFYRPMTMTSMSAHLDNSGKALGLEVHSACESIMRTRNPKAETDNTIEEGLVDTDYAFEASYVDYHMSKLGVPVGFWRSVGYSQNTWAVESFADELAELEGKDPYQWRRERLAAHDRKRNVLEVAAKNANWGKSASGHVQGIAIAHSYGSTVAEVVEANVSADGEIKISKITCVVDCGLAINPDSIRAQMESSIVYGLTAAMYGEVTIEKGAAVQSNFHQYEMMRIRHMPVVDVHIIESDGKPGGIGEPGLPPVAPALCNAIYAATGKRIRKLPLINQGFKFS